MKNSFKNQLKNIQSSNSIPIKIKILRIQALKKCIQAQIELNSRFQEKNLNYSSVVSKFNKLYKDVNQNIYEYFMAAQREHQILELAYEESICMIYKKQILKKMQNTNIFLRQKLMDIIQNKKALLSLSLAIVDHMNCKKIKIQLKTERLDKKLNKNKQKAQKQNNKLMLKHENAFINNEQNHNQNLIKFTK